MLDRYRTSIKADTNRVNTERALGVNPDTPIGLVHEGPYIASLIESFPYRTGVMIREPTIREFIVHAAATYANKGIEYHVTPRHSTAANLGSKGCIINTTNITKALLKNPPEGIRHGSTFADLRISETNNANYNKIMAFIDAHSDEEFKQFFANYQGDPRIFFKNLLTILDEIRVPKSLYSENVIKVLLPLCKRHNIDLDVLKAEMLAHLASDNMPAIQPERTSVLQHARVINAFRQ